MIPALDPSKIKKMDDHKCDICGCNSGYAARCFLCKIGIEPEFPIIKRESIYKKPDGIDMSAERYATARMWNRHK